MEIKTKIRYRISILIPIGNQPLIIKKINFLKSLVADEHLDVFEIGECTSKREEKKRKS